MHDVNFISSGQGVSLQTANFLLVIFFVENSHQPMEILFTTANSIQYISGFICGLLGAFLAAYSYSLPWLASILSTLLAVWLCVFYMHENKWECTGIKSRNVVTIIGKVSKLVCKTSR